MICASLQTYRYLGFAGHEPDVEQRRQEARQVQRVMPTLRRVFSRAGTYGMNLLRRVDPTNQFRVHNGIGNLLGG